MKSASEYLGTGEDDLAGDEDEQHHFGLLHAEH